MVFQNVFLFADSIENNIKFGKPDATHEEVVRAAKSACCHDFIMALPNGYDTVIGESGATLSLSLIHILVITHDLQVASRLCEVIYEIEHGKITKKAVR